MLIRILDFARERGLRFQFCASNRVLRAFPALGDAILDHGHDLDWYCKHPLEPEMRWPTAQELFSRLGKQPEGIAFKTPPPPQSSLDSTFRWTCGGALSGVFEIPVQLFSLHTDLTSGVGYKKCLDDVSKFLHPQLRPCCLAIRPQDLRQFDPRLGGLDQLFKLCDEDAIPILTLRQANQTLVG